MRFRAVALLMVLLVLGVARGAAQSPWDEYERHTLREIVHAQEAAMPPGSNISLLGEPVASRVTATYTGMLRPLAGEHRDLLEQWVRAFDKAPALLELFATEMLVREGTTEYWLPVQTTLVPSLRQELKPGDTVELLASCVGGDLHDGAWDWVLIVDEFAAR